MNIYEALDFLSEKFVNVFEPDKKKKYVDDVWDILQKSYEYAGGIKGSGFESKEDMIEKIPFWKLNVKNGKVIAVKMYKNKDGRKSVASGVLKDDKANYSAYAEMVKHDLKRAYMEISDKSLDYIKNLLGDDFQQFVIPVEKVKEKLKKADIIPIDSYFYQRKINGEYITKIMIGNINAAPIYFLSKKQVKSNK